MKKFVMGLLIGSFVMFSAQTFGATVGMVGKKIQGETNVLLNGTVLDKGIIVDGKSFAPVRTISETAGYEVGFSDGKVSLVGGVKVNAAMPIDSINKSLKIYQSELEVENIMLASLEKKYADEDVTQEKYKNLKTNHEARIIQLQLLIAELEKQKAALVAQP